MTDNETRFGVLKGLAAGEISLMEATRRLGYSDAGHTLHALADAGLSMPKLPAEAEAVQEQAQAGIDAMRSAVKRG